MAAPAGGRDPWAVITIDSPAEAEEDLVRVLCDGGALGVQAATGFDDDLPDGRAILHAYFDAGRPLPGLEELERLCPAARGMKLLSTRAVADERWVERWIASLDPFDVGERFRVIPVVDADEPGAAPESAGGDRIPLRIVPGRAFGTGEHATTRLCLEALESLEGAEIMGRDLLDVGTGSGILAMAGLALGARSALGVDIDPEAIRVATANLALNPGASGLELRVCGPGELGARYGVVLANLNSGILEECMESLTGALCPGGILVLSGLLEVEADAVSALAESAGAPRLRSRTMEGWACTVHRAALA